VSGKATPPTDIDQPQEATRSMSHVSVSKAKRWTKYDVRPKVSIPTDIAPQEYARQCIAAAESSRLNPFGLHPEELSLLQAHLTYAQVTTYLNIRNSILRLWTRNPLIAVHRNEAVGCARDSRWFDVASLCYEWLVRRGYINYGCVENIDSQYPKSRGTKRKRKTIAVIGAGMSGLGCARQLEGLFAQFEDRFREQGEDVPNVVLLEGRGRIGGRVYSRGLESKPTSSKLPDGSRCTAEMGGMIITGFDRGNPLNIIVRGQLALPYHALRPTTEIYDSNGQPVDHRRDQLAESLYNDVLDRVSDYKFKTNLPKIVEGDKYLLEAGRDAPSDGHKMQNTISQDMAAELHTNAPAIGIQALPELRPAPCTNHRSIINSLASDANAIATVPVSSDRLTGRAHLEPGIPAVHTAAYKARMMGWQLKAGVSDVHDLNLVPAVVAPGATLGSVMDEAINQYRDIVHILPLDLRLMNWHVANLEYSNAIPYGELSLGGWDVDAGNEWEGKHTQIIGGYQQVPRGLLHCPQPLDVRKNCVVKRITYSTGETRNASKIECDDGQVIVADYVVSSVPLGVLKHGSIQFEPPLPDWKTGSIERLGFGVLNKVILVYKEAFWDRSRDIFGILREPIHRASLNQKDYTFNRGRFFQWFNCTKTSGVPTLIALMAGDAAFQTENNGDSKLIAEATAILRNVFGPTVPDPVEAVVTRWGHDRFARGSYSYTGPNFRPDDYEVMAKPIGNLFFAGEHTCGTHPATVHGAYISGLRAASEVLDAIIGPIAVPEPLLPLKETTANLKRKASGASPQVSNEPQLSPLEAYEREIWTAIYAKLGDPPWRPAKISANPYILYGKDKFETARRKCEEGRRPGKGKPVPNEVRIMLAKMWKEATDAEKQPYNDKAALQKEAYAAALSDFTAKAIKWDQDALAFRKEYEAAHPLKSKMEDALDWDTPTRDRKAKRVNGYAEDSESELEA
jgi:monoamine oxidase